MDMQQIHYDVCNIYVIGDRSSIIVLTIDPTGIQQHSPSRYICIYYTVQYTGVPVWCRVQYKHTVQAHPCGHTYTGVTIGLQAYL